MTPPHAIMFHHFHGGIHPEVQGSISAEQLEAIISHYGDRMISADRWYQHFIDGDLLDQVCLSFDDGLRCQYDVALPVMERLGLNAFWFIFTSVMDGGVEMFEVWRKFRTTCFDSVEDFYQAFQIELIRSIGKAAIAEMLMGYDHDDWKDFPFYSELDTRFRFLRDRIGDEQYGVVMDRMMAKKGVHPETLANGLWMTQDHLRTLHGGGHIIGLHSHTHPMKISELELGWQGKEYVSNLGSLIRILGIVPDTMSHPCNSYNSRTIRLLNAMDIKLGFRANMAEGYSSDLEMPREDAANLVRSLEACPA